MVVLITHSTFQELMIDKLRVAHEMESGDWSVISNL